jgi:hypothetical protein
MVGRDRELRVLEGCLDALRQGRGQIASIVGEAGIGKSRLKVELREHLASGVQWFEGRCQAHTEMMSYVPFVQILRSACRLGGAEPAAIARTKLRASLRGQVGPRDVEVQPAIAQLLGIETGPAGSPGPPTDPRAFQSQLIVGMRALVEAVATRQPAVIAFEDVHWADPASVELLTVLLELTDVVPLMLLITCRPDAEGRSWDLRFHAQRNYPHRLTEIPIAPWTRRIPRRWRATSSTSPTSPSSWGVRSSHDRRETRSSLKRLCAPSSNAECCKARGTGGRRSGTSTGW